MIRKLSGNIRFRKVDRTARRVQLSYPKWVPPRLPSIRPTPAIAGEAWIDGAG